jgi:subtilisin family serine protease
MTSRMHRRLASLWGVALILVLGTPHAARAGGDEDQPIPFQVVVRLQPGVSVTAVNAQYGSATLDSIPAARWHLLQTPPDLDERAFAKLLVADVRVQSVELHFTGRDTNPDPGTQSIFFGAVASDHENQPAYGSIGLGQALLGPLGAGVRVAVIDSGIDRAHAAFLGRIIETGFNVIDGNTDTRDLGDGLDNNGDGTIDEAVGHGTAVSGIILRLAPNVRLMPLRALDSDGQTTVFRVAKAIHLAVDGGSRVINVSLGTTADQEILRSAVAYAASSGAVIVSSSGNDATLQPARFPAGYGFASGVLSVAGVSDSSIVAPFSNYGPHVSLTAPSVLIASTIPGGLFGKANGTSFGAPMVSAAVALTATRFPTLSTSAAADRVRTHTRPIQSLNPGFEGLLGTGTLDLVRVLGRPRATFLLPPALSNDAVPDRLHRR